MYGKAILAEEVNKILSKELNRYINEENLQILGEPLPNETEQKKIDFDQDMNWDLKSLLNIIDDIIEKEFQRGRIEFINSPTKSGIISIVNYDVDDNLIETILVSTMNRVRFVPRKANL